MQTIQNKTNITKKIQKPNLFNNQTVVSSKKTILLSTIIAEIKSHKILK